MAYQVALKELMARVRQRANLEGATAFLPDAELVDMINASIADWYDELRGTTWGGTYARSSFTFTTVSGTQVYPLPPDFLSLISVDVFVTPGSPVISAVAYSEEERNTYRMWPILTGWSSISFPVYYQLQGPNISFIPIPLGVHSVQLNYYPTAPKLSAPDDALDSINSFDDYIVIDAAIKALIKAGEHESIPFLEQRLAGQRERIRAMASRRDQGTAERVQVVQNRGVNSDWDW